jgi:hypothetical protein
MNLRCSLTITVAIATVATLSAQALQPQHTLSVIVDGSKTPDRIPDDLAYHHFVLAVAERQNPSKEEFTRRELRLRPVGLSKNDQDLCISALAGLREELDAVETARRAVIADAGATNDSALASLKARQDAAVAKVRAALRNMSVEGQSLLDGYIKTHVKRHITILGSAH